MTDQLSADERRRDAAPDTGQDDDPSSGSPTAETSRGRFGRAKGPRISKWDRPPEPHDWRFYVGRIGRVLIATGLLMFGFVAYQLWGTGIETAMAQNRLEDRFDTLLAERDTDDATPAVDAPSTDETGRPGAAGTDTPSNDSSPPTTDGGSTDDGDTTTEVPATVDPSDAAIVNDPIPQPTRGEPLLRLEIPAIGRDDIVVPGVALSDLQDGPGHYPDTPLPGQLGNAAIAGHRTTYGAPFFDVDQLEAGDEIITTLSNGDRFVYEVTFVEVVSASDYWVVTTRNPDIAELTLTSCHPKYTARDRIIVHSVLNPEKSSNVGLPTFYTLDDDAEAGPIAGDDPVVTADIVITQPDSALGELDEPVDGTVDETAVDADDEAVAGTGAGGTPPRPATGEESADARPAAAEPADAFGRGWFDDRGAFLQIALWGVALALVSLLARQVARRYRRDSIGLLVGVTPFVVALYFFYQNVNRLLPPGI